MGVKKYIPSPTGAKFHAAARTMGVRLSESEQDDADYTPDARFMMGPIGSGKTVTCTMDMLYRSMAQPPIDGRRKSRWLVIRRTFPELKSTVIQTFSEWIGDLGTFKWGSPIEWKTERSLSDRTVLDMEVMFMALDGPTAISKLKSLEITAAYISEYSTVDPSIIPTLLGRIGRYPAFNKDDPAEVALAQSFWSGLIAESNPPSTRSYYYDLLEVQRPKGYTIFYQPPAVLYDDRTEKYYPNPDAENVENHREKAGYWMKQIAGASDEYIKVMLMGQYGSIFTGTPVFAGSYDDREHVAKTPLQPMTGFPIIVGMDWGLQPAAVFTQMLPSGGIHVLDELAPKRAFLEDFLNKQVIPLINKKYRGMTLQVVGDPSGSGRDARSRLDSFQFLAQRGLAARPASTNDPVLRVEAVNHFLRRKGGFLMNRECQVLREGFLGGYRFEEGNDASGTYVKPKIHKGAHSHPMDALQYACLYHFGGVSRDARTVSRKLKAARNPVPKRQGRGYLYV